MRSPSRNAWYGQWALSAKLSAPGGRLVTTSPWLMWARKESARSANRRVGPPLGSQAEADRSQLPAPGAFLDPAAKGLGHQLMAKTHAVDRHLPIRSPSQKVLAAGDPGIAVIGRGWRAGGNNPGPVGLGQRVLPGVEHHAPLVAQQVQKGAFIAAQLFGHPPGQVAGFEDEQGLHVTGPDGRAMIWPGALGWA